jgi:hypothetical protein
MQFAAVRERNRAMQNICAPINALDREKRDVVA